MGKKGKKDGKAKGAGAGPAARSDPAVAKRGTPSVVDPGQLATRLTSSAVHLLRRLHREDAALGVSSTRLSALSVLVLGGPHTLGALAAAEGVTPPSMTRLVTAMEADGLVERTRSDRDGRLVIVRATSAGEELLHRDRDQRASALASMVGSLAPDDRSALDRAAGILESLLRPTRPA